MGVVARFDWLACWRSVFFFFIVVICFVGHVWGVQVTGGVCFVVVLIVYLLVLLD